MQAHPMKGLPLDELNNLNERLDGMVENPVLFDAELMDKAVNDPDVEEVRVFKLRHGQKIKIGAESFKVFRVGKNVTLRPF